MFTSGYHAPYGLRQVVLSAVSLAGVYASPAKAKPVLEWPVSTGRQRRLSADIGRES